MRQLEKKVLLVGMLCGVIVVSSSLAYARKDTEAKIILEKMINGYHKLSTYQDTGVVETTMDGGARKQVMTQPFSLIFKRPSRLRFEWAATAFAGKNNRNILWSNGNETYTYWEQLNQYMKDSSLQMGIAGATGVSGGSANTVPSMLLMDSTLTRLSDLSLLAQEMFEGTQCYVISGKMLGGIEYKLWIGIDDYLLRKSQYTVKSTREIMKQAESALKEAERKVPMTQLSEMPDFSFITQEIHREINVDKKISDEVFKFIPPEGTKLVEAFSVTTTPSIRSAQAKHEKEKITITATPQDIKTGKDIYLKHCVWCHGVDGAGDGPAARRLAVKPRNFNAGVFKIRSTASGQLPTDEDLSLTVKHGMPGTTMPGYEKILSDVEQRQVIAFLKKQLAKKRNFDDPKEIFSLTDYGTQTSPLQESVQKGKELYTKAKCHDCHGLEGRGDGNLKLKDDWGFPILPADLTKAWNFRGNRQDPYYPKHIFRTLSTGMDGTPMRSYADSLSVEERWHLANFVISLSPRYPIDPIPIKPSPKFVIESEYIKDDLPATVEDPQWERVKPAYIALASNIIHRPRHFISPTDNLYVRSLHNNTEVAFLLEWNDRTRSIQEEKRNPLYDAEALKVVEEMIDNGKVTKGKAIGASRRMVFNDAVALQFPQKWQTLIPKQPIISDAEFRKEIQKGSGGPLLSAINAAQFTLPYFIFGDEERGVDLWKWESDGTVHLFAGHGIDRLNEHKNNKSVIVTDASYRHGQWRLVMKRSLTTKDPDNDVQFQIGRHIPIAFFVWDGDAGEINGKMALSTHYYLAMKPTEEGQPHTLRTVHPSPPESIAVHGKTFNLKGSTNPYRSDGKGEFTEKFLKHVRAGGSVYFDQGGCLFCHGANLDGRGIFAHVFQSYTSNFTDPGTIAQLQESYVFWRVAKGGPAVPKFSLPWASAMPPGEEHLTTDEIWKVILYLYWRTGYSPSPFGIR